MQALVIDYLHPAGIELLSRYLSVTCLPQPPSTDELARLIGDYHALVMRVTPRIDQTVLANPGKLRVISIASVGLDHVDLAVARDKGIKVFNQPGINRDSVAEFTFGLLICLARRLVDASREVKEGTWKRNRYQNGLELSGRTLGIIGLGASGSRVAELARSFRMRVLSFSPYSSDRRASDLGVQLATLDELLTESDFVSVHCPLTPETRNLIGPRQLALMRPGSFLLNLARGGIVDEMALYDALSCGHLAGAASDVFATEPPGHHPLLTLPTFIGTPHIAGPTADSLWRASVQAAESVLHHLGIPIGDAPPSLAANA